ncbi:uracil-DNA glycosylase family protein [Alicycliphilus denitrificans]|uniref:uracil-DNA glycosylase family protein n=1 Tax=Alicycliphilus denitrificans TaxID=179636 RepID=UPI00384BAD69
MSLSLDARQRAMLQEMGVTVWAAPPARAAATPASPSPPAARTTAPVPAQGPGTATAAPQAPAPAQRTTAPVAGTPATGLLLRPPVALYPQADPAATPPALGASWLVVLESPSPAAPLAGDSGRLLDNMLRAMRLHRHPRCFVATLARAAPGLPAEGDPPTAGLQQALATLRPSMVLVLGLGAARAVLGSREPLGRLRAGVHHLAGDTPAIVSYDPAYLLRAPEAKAAAWADLCRALALVRPAA